MGHTDRTTNSKKTPTLRKHRRQNTTGPPIKGTPKMEQRCLHNHIRRRIQNRMGRYRPLPRRSKKNREEKMAEPIVMGIISKSRTTSHRRNHSSFTNPKKHTGDFCHRPRRPSVGISSHTNTHPLLLQSSAPPTRRRYPRHLHLRTRPKKPSRRT